jgi:rare lipoprotein A
LYLSYGKTPPMPYALPRIACAN